MKNILIAITILLFTNLCIAQKYEITGGSVKLNTGGSSGTADTSLYVLDSLSDVDKTIIPLSASIYVREAGKEGLFTPAVNQSASIDDAIIIADGIGTRFKRVFEVKDGVNPEWFGATLGQLKNRYPTKTYAELNAIRYNNIEALQAAFAYSVANGTYTLLTDTLEIWGGFPNTFTVADDQKLTLRGTGVESYVDLYPKYYHNQSIFRFLTINEGANIDISDITFNGREYETYFQTYTAVLKPGGNTTEIDIPDSVSIWSGFWSSLQTGDTLFYARNITTVGFFGIIASVDSTTRLITLNANLDAAVSSDHVGLVGCYWKEQEVSDSDITTYGRKWQNQAALSVLFYSGIGASVITNEGIWKISNFKTINYKQGFSVAGGNIAGYFTNCYISSHEVGMSRFTGDGNVTGNPSIWEFRNLELTNCGFYQDGGMVHQGGVTAGNIWGSGAYLHPSAIVRVYDSYIYNNTALAWRQYSSGGARVSARDAYSVFDGVRFTNNGEINLLLSSSMPNIVKNCRFERGNSDGGVRLGASTTFENCYFNDEVLSYAESTPNVAIWETLTYKFNNCTFDSLGRVGFQAGSWSTSLFSKVDLSVTNCTFILDNANAAQKISTTSTATGFNMLVKDVIFKPLSRLTKDSTVQSIFQAPSGGRLIADNISYITNNQTWATSLFGANPAYAGGVATINNSNLPINTLAGSSFVGFQKFIEIDGTPVPSIYEFRTSVRVKGLKKATAQGLVATTAPSNSNWGSTITFDKVLKIKPVASTFFVDADTVKAIMLVQDTIAGASYTTMLNSVFEGEVTIVAQRNMTFVPDGVYSKSNIKGTTYIPVLKGEAITFKSLPNNCICASETVSDTITLATADGVATTFSSSFPADTDPRTAPFIPYTAKLIAGAVELPLDYNFYGSSASVAGWVSNYFSAYSFTFAVAPANTTPIQIVTNSCVSPQWRGYFVVKK